MAAQKPVEARYGLIHNIGMTVVSALMITAAIVHFATNSNNAPTLSLNDPRFVVFALLAMAMGYYAFLGVSRFRNREPQVVIDRDGILLGFGRNHRIAWDDIQWVRLRRLAMRPQRRPEKRPKWQTTMCTTIPGLRWGLQPQWVS